MADSYTMTDTFELPGKFWLPGQAENAVAGRIKCSPDSISLVLDGDFEEAQLTPPERFKRFFGLDSDEWPSILGRTTEGRPCSLFRVFATNQHSNMNGLVSRTCHVHFLLIGHCTDNFDSMKVKRIGAVARILRILFGRTTLKMNTASWTMAENR